MRGLIVIDPVPMLFTLKTNDLLVFVDETGPLTITSPEASITGGTVISVLAIFGALLNVGTPGFITPPRFRRCTGTGR